MVWCSIEQRQYSDAPDVKLVVGAKLGLDDGTVSVKLRNRRRRNVD
jgi:hypothetical protein